MILGIGNALTRIGKNALTFVKDSLKLYFNFKSNDPSLHLAGSTSFDGDDYISVSDDSSLDMGTSDFTLSAWAKTTSSAIVGIHGQGLSGANPIKLIYLNGGYFKGAVEDSSTNSVDSTADGGTWNDGEWHHFTCVFKYGDKMYRYVDGKPIGTNDSISSVGSTDGTADYNIGAYNNGASGLFDGSIANVSIHSRALSESEIQSIMWKNYADLSTTEKNNLVSWYGMDDTTNGSELISSASNTSFASDKGNWADYQSGTASWDSNGYLVLDTTDGSASGVQLNGSYIDDVPIGTTVSISFDVKLGTMADDTTGNTLSFQSATPTIGYTATSSWQTVTGTSVTGSSNPNLYLKCHVDNADGGTLLFDNISIKPVVASDSEGSNDGTIVGATVNNTSYGGASPFLPRIQDNSPDSLKNYGDIYSGTALSFDGSNDYVALPYYHTSEDEITVSFWFYKNDSDVSNNYVVGMGARIYAGQTACYVTSGVINWKVGNALTSSTGIDLRDGVWHRIVLTYDESNAKIYVDGALNNSASVTGNLGVHGSLHRIGASVSSDGFFAGSLCDYQVWNKVWELSDVQYDYNNPETLITNNASVTSGITTSNLKGSWLLNEGSGSVAYDGSGNQNHGTITGATWDTSEKDIYQTALVRANEKMFFGGSGSGDYVNLGSSMSLTSTASTLSFWVNRDESTSKIFKDSSGNGNFITVDSSVISHRANGTYTTYTITVPTSSWTHLVITRDGGSGKIYMDGSLEDTQTTSETFSFDEIGRGISAGEFQGNLDEVAIWDEAITSSEITALYNSGTPIDASADSGNYASSNNLVGYWRNEGTNTWTDLAPTIGATDYIPSQANRDFSGSDNYTDYNGATSSIVNGEKEITLAGSGASGVYLGSGYINTTTASSTYRVSIDMYAPSTGGTSNQITLRLGNTSASAITLTDTKTTYTKDITVSSHSHLFVYVPSGADGGKYIIDNVSIVAHQGGNDGTVNGSPATILLPEGITSGKDNQGFPLQDTTAIKNGIRLYGNEYVEVPISDALDLGENDFTIEAWIKPTLGTGDSLKQIIYMRGQTSPNTGIEFQVDDSSDRLRAIIDNGASATEFLGGNNGVTGNWQHAVVTVDRSADELKFYLDATQNGTTKDISSLSGSYTYDPEDNPTIGVKLIGSTLYQKYLGQMDEVRLYVGKALSSDEVNKNRSHGLSKHS